MLESEIEHRQPTASPLFICEHTNQYIRIRTLHRKKNFLQQVHEESNNYRKSRKIMFKANFKVQLANLLAVSGVPAILTQFVLFSHFIDSISLMFHVLAIIISSITIITEIPREEKWNRKGPFINLRLIINFSAGFSLM